ncbi:MAG TPA: helix-turn-helix domain-containing protein, partial [Alphaproteobacteria bacterium]|nr:helix-turn-helix domain-containing protein [Alphaproteobacteria bacterium]
MTEIVNKAKMTLHDYVTRESGFEHHSADAETQLCQLLQAGDMDAVDFCQRNFGSPGEGRLANDPFTNIQYSYVCSVTLMTRFSIWGGMDEKEAFHSSDLYIQRLETCSTIDEVKDLHRKMMMYFVKYMDNLKNNHDYSKPIAQCIDYIYFHLHDKFTVKELAEHVNLSPNYLSTLFKKETGMSVVDYILERRLNSAKYMLQYTDMSCSDIASSLTFG